MKSRNFLKSDPEKNRFNFFQLGLIIALVAVLFAFEWKSYDSIMLDLCKQSFVTIEEDIVINTQPKKPPPPPKPFRTTILNIVDDDVNLDDDWDIDIVFDPDDDIPFYVPVIYDEKGDDTDDPFVVVEENPEFPGGETARLIFLRDNTKYPQLARESLISGTVHLTFVVEKDGSITNVKIIRGIGGGCDDEAIRVAQAMPKWKPGKQRGKAVRVQFNMPLKFTLATE